MLVHLTDEALEEGFSLTDADEWFWSGLSRLAYAHRDGRHELAAGFTLEKLLKQRGDRFDPYAAATLRGLRSTDRQAAVGAVRVRVDIVAGRSVSPVWTSSGTPFKASMDWFMEESASRPALLLVEGDDDGEVLERVAGAWAAHHKAPLPKLERRIGAGGNYLKVLALVQVRERGPWIGVLDSDRSVPAASLGSTAANALKVWERRGVCDLRVLSAHELENLMPAALAEAVAEAVPEWSANIHHRIEGRTWHADPYENRKDTIGPNFLTRCAEALCERGHHANWQLLALSPHDELYDLGRAIAEFGRAPPKTRT